jgi:hypothetical protein
MRRDRRSEHRRRNYLAGTDEAGRQAWQAINTLVDVLNKIVSCVIQFGAKSTSFLLIELPANLHGTAGIHDLASLCTGPQHDLAAASAVFHPPGSHRNAPWFLAAPALRLSSIAEAREKARAWSEAAWDALELNRGRGRFEPQKGFIPMPVKNPYAAAQPPPRRRNPSCLRSPTYLCEFYRRSRRSPTHPTRLPRGRPGRLRGRKTVEQGNRPRPVR